MDHEIGSKERRVHIPIALFSSYLPSSERGISADRRNCNSIVFECKIFRGVKGIAELDVHPSRGGLDLSSQDSFEIV